MFKEIISDVYSVFASYDWLSNNIKAYPSNYIAELGVKEFVRISVLPAAPRLIGHNMSKEMSGIVIFSIFVEAGEGDSRVFAIADIIQKLFSGKTLPNKTSFTVGYIKTIGPDKDNPALYRADYSLNFRFFGD